MTSIDIKNLRCIDIIAPHFKYFRSSVKQTSDYKKYAKQLNDIEFMKNNALITDVFHKVGILVHIYTLKDDFLNYSESSSIEEYDYLIN